MVKHPLKPRIQWMLILDGSRWYTIINIYPHIYLRYIQKYKPLENCILMLCELKIKCHHLTTKAAFTIYWSLTRSNFSVQLGTKTKCWNSWISPRNSNFNFCSAPLNVTSVTFFLPVRQVCLYYQWETILIYEVGKQPLQSHYFPFP